jgi:hypothetical protein
MSSRPTVGVLLHTVKSPITRHRPHSTPCVDQRDLTLPRPYDDSVTLSDIEGNQFQVLRTLLHTS